MIKILVPTDFSELGKFAFDFASLLAKKMNAKIEILSIAEAPNNAQFTSAGEFKTDNFPDLTMVDEELTRLEELMKDFQPDHDLIEKRTLKVARMRDFIPLYAQNEDVDFIVMGTDGAKGAKEFFAGSNAQHIVRAAKCPVITLKCDRSQMELTDILLVSDFHEKETLDLRLLKQIQGAFGATVRLLKINTPGNFVTERNVKINMKQFADRHNLENAKYHLYCDNTVEEGIINFCIDEGVDFVAMGTHQRKGLGRLFRKSVSEDVVNHVWQPILTFKV